MNWADERYVRVYTRDTMGWMKLGWEAQALFYFLVRQADRAGVLSDYTDPDGLAAFLRMPPEMVSRALPKLVNDGCLEIHGTYLLIPNYVEAQEANQSDAQRQRDQRERRKALAAAGTLSRGVTNPPGVGHTDPAFGHSVPSHAMPSHAKPTSQPPPPKEPGGILPPLLPTPTPQKSLPLGQAIVPTGDPPKAKPLLKTTVAVREVWDHYLAKISPRAILDAKGAKLISDRLVQFASHELGGVGAIKRAIEGYAVSPWHSGDNDLHRKYQSIELICRDVKHIEQGIDLAANPSRDPERPPKRELPPRYTALDITPEERAKADAFLASPDFPHPKFMASSIVRPPLDAPKRPPPVELSPEEYARRREIMRQKSEQLLANAGLTADGAPRGS